MANWKQVASDVLSALQSTTGLSSPEKKRLRDDFISENESSFSEFLERTGFSDTAGNRSKFLVWKGLGYWRDSARAGDMKKKRALAREDAQYKPNPLAEVEDPD